MTPRRHTIEELAASISSLARRAVAEYAPDQRHLDLNQA